MTEYYGSQRARDAYDPGHVSRSVHGDRLPDEESTRLLQVEIPGNQLFQCLGYYNYHGGGNVLFDDETILNWIIQKNKTERN